MVGALYAPHDNSIHRTGDVFDDIALDAISINAKFDCPMVILGDANAYTATLNDECNALLIDDKLGYEFGFDLFCQVDEQQGNPIQIPERANFENTHIEKKNRNVCSKKN